MMKEKWPILFVSTLLLCLAGQACTGNVTMEFTASVTTVYDPDNALGGAIAVDDTLTGRVTYNLLALDLDADPDSGEYRDYSLPSGIFASCNGITFKTDPDNIEVITAIENDFTGGSTKDWAWTSSTNNLFSFQTAPGPDNILIYFTDTSGTAITSDIRPASYDLDAWNYGQGIFFCWDKVGASCAGEVLAVFNSIH